MIEFRTLGCIDLRDSGREELRAILSQPKRLALLSYLVLSGGVRRDTLVALFWPDLDQEHARGALRQSLRGLRRALGPDGGLNHMGEEELSLDGDALRCDATAFEQACDEGRFEEALDLYRGDLLPGLFVPGASSEFEQWIEAERVRLRSRACAAAWSLAERARGADDPLGTARWGRRAVDLALYDEGQLRRLLRLLDESGDRAGAVHAFEEFSQRLRVEYDIGPSAETQALIAAIRSRETSHSVPITATLPWGGATEVSIPSVRVEAGAVSRAGIGRVPAGRSPGFRWGGKWLLLPTTLLVVVIIAAYLHATSASGRLQPLDPERLIIAPFRVTSQDSSFGYLAEGMTDLLAAALTGDGGPAVVDARSGLAAWRSAEAEGAAGIPRRAARNVGAGQIMLGEVVITGDSEIEITARLEGTATGRPMARASAAGSVGNLPELVDRLAVQLLEQMGSIPARHERESSRAPIGAVRNYLEGQSLFRQGRYVEADAAFNRALDSDSTYLPAAFGLAWSASWTGRWERGYRLAWPRQGELSPGERAQLQALAGRHYPDVPSERETLVAWESAVTLSEYRPEVWFALGSRLERWGARLSVPQWQQRAYGAFRRAIAFDSTFAGPIEELLFLAATIRDTATVREMARRADRLKSPPENIRFLHWLAAASLADSASIRAQRDSLAQMHFLTLYQIVPTGQRLTFGLEDARRAARLLEASAGDRSDLSSGLRLQRALALNEGRPLAAAAYLRASQQNALSPGAAPATVFAVLALKAPGSEDRMAVMDALYWEGDSTMAQEASVRLTRRVNAAPDGIPAIRAEQYLDACVLGQWHSRHAQLAEAERALAILRPHPERRDSLALVNHNRVCTGLLEALLASARHHPDTRAAIERLDSLLLEGLPPFPPFAAADLVLAGLRLDQGDSLAAMATLNREIPMGGITYLSTYLLARARLAARLGDRVTAVEDYEHYLALRSDPEPSLRPLVDSVRAELDTLRSNPRH